jgi:hypothetical protein
MSVDHDRVRREDLRWLAVLTLNKGRPSDLPEEQILSVAQAVYPDATPIELRQALDYLAERDLIELDRAPHGRWRAKLTRCGIDLAEYTVACEPGIARPAKYW